jgi:hypothetical protein
LANRYNNIKVLLIIDAEFRLSSKLVDEYASLKNVAYERIDSDSLSSTVLIHTARELALDVQRKKHMLSPIYFN